MAETRRRAAAATGGSGVGRLLGFRIIGILKLLSAVLALMVVFGLFRLFRSDVRITLEHLARHVRLDSENSAIHRLITWVSGIDREHLHLLEAGTLFYATLHTVEGVALLTGRRWGAWLTIVATSSLIPLECLEIARNPGPLRILVLAVNLGIVAYLVANRRLPDAAEPGGDRA